MWWNLNRTWTQCGRGHALRLASPVATVILIPRSLSLGDGALIDVVEDVAAAPTSRARPYDKLAILLELWRHACAAA